MTTLEKITFWGDHHNPKWLVLFRIALGLALVWKGIAFIMNLNVLADFLHETGLTDSISASVTISVLADLIIALHLIGGVCIAIGLRTRMFCLFNLPVLLGAVFLIDLKQSILKPYSEIWLSILVLFTIIVFLIHGNGQLAVDHDVPETTTS